MENSEWLWLCRAESSQWESDYEIHWGEAPFSGNVSGLAMGSRHKPDLVAGPDGDLWALVRGEAWRLEDDLWAQPFDIEHYLSVFARALGIEHEDTYKKYMLSGDTDKILADMAPCMQANGVNPDEARRMVDKTFSRK